MARLQRDRLAVSSWLSVQRKRAFDCWLQPLPCHVLFPRHTSWDPRRSVACMRCLCRLALLAWQHLGVVWHSDILRHVLSTFSPASPPSCNASRSLHPFSPFHAFSLAGLRTCLLLTERVSPVWERCRFSCSDDRRPSSASPSSPRGPSPCCSPRRPPFRSSFDPTAQAISCVVEETLRHISPRHKGFVLLSRC